MKLCAAAIVLLLSGISVRAADDTFQAASIKPNTSGLQSMQILPIAGGRFTSTNVSLGILVAVAYDVRGFQISGLPGWAWSEKYDIVAKAEGSPKYDQFRAMLQQLLAERFRLRLHHEPRAMKGFALVQDKHGAKPLKAHNEECAPDSRCGGFVINLASIDGVRVNMKQLAGTLAQQRDVGRPVVDKTGIAGSFDITLRWSTDGGDDALSVFTALQEQLGLRLDAEIVETEMLIVDGAERASAN